MVKCLVFFCVVVASTMAFAYTRVGNLESLVRFDSQVAAQGFSKKLVKGKLDKLGYGPLREKVGPLAPSQDLQAGEPILIPQSVIIYNENHIEKSYYVFVYKGARNEPRPSVPSLVTKVHCKITRYAQSNRFRGYIWAPDCRVIEAALP